MSVNISNSIFYSAVVGTKSFDNKKIEIDKSIPKSSPKKAINHYINGNVKIDLSIPKLNFSNLAEGIKRRQVEELSTNLTEELNDDILESIISCWKSLLVTNVANIYPLLTCSKQFYKISIVVLAKLTNLNEISWNLRACSPLPRKLSVTRSTALAVDL
ncbi:MAG: hypothetical protein H0W50_09535, partial [Parachlamydiaceae bacterium]|nr:hypothetical protein [Parachlamydiaceae bacterium]